MGRGGWLAGLGQAGPEGVPFTSSHAEEEPLVACLACGSHGGFRAFNLAGCCKPEEAEVKFGRSRALQRPGGGTHPSKDKKGTANDPMSDAPGLPEAWQLEVSPPRPQMRLLRLGREACLGYAPRLPPAWAVTGRAPKARRRSKQPDCAGHPKGP